MNKTKSLFIATLLFAQQAHAVTPLSGQSEFETIKYRLNSGGNEPDFPFQTSGLSGAEPTHTWTDGSLVTFTIPPVYGDKRPSRIIFKDVTGLVSQDLSQSIYIYINNQPLKKLELTAHAPIQTIDLSLPHNLTGSTIIDFDLPKARQAREVDPTNTDPRVLALLLSTVDIIFEKGQHKLLNMGQEDLNPITLRHGFAVGEGSHRWSSGKHAQISFPTVYASQHIRQVTFETSGLVSMNSDHLTQRLIVSGNFISPREYIYNKDHPTHKVTIDAPENVKGQFVIDLDLPTACLPKVLDANNLDPHELAICFRTADIVYFDSPFEWVKTTNVGRDQYKVVNHTAIVGADKLHSFAQGQGTKVIVIDSGVDVNHPDLIQNLTQTTKNTLFSQQIDHGTHVSGIVKSIAPQTQLEVISALSPVELINAMKSATRSTGDVVNISMRFACVHNNDLIIRNAFVEAFEALAKSGKVVMMSFGNEFNNQSLLKDYGIHLSNGLIEMVKDPRLMGRVRLVSNLSYEDFDEKLHQDSCRALTECPFAISAPGTDILSDLPDNQQGVLTGTSMAAPVVTGTYALLKSAIPGLTPEQYLDLIVRSARKYNRSGLKLDHTYGVGVVNAYEAFKLYHMSNK